MNPSPLTQPARKYLYLDTSGNDCSSDSDSSDDSSCLRAKSFKQRCVKKQKVENILIPSFKSDNDKTEQRKKPPFSCSTTNVSTFPEKTQKISTSKMSSKFSLSSDSDTDDDDALLSCSNRVFDKSKKPQRFAAKANQNAREKERKKREREAQKERERQSRIRKRKEAKDEKERRKQQAKIAKQQQNEEYNQVMGKHRHEEIAVLLDSDLHKDDPYGLVKALSIDFSVHPHVSGLSNGLSSSAASIQFIRNDKVLGGAIKAIERLESGDQGYEHIEYLALIFEPDEFLPLLHRDSQEDDDDYPALESWLNGIRTRWQRVWSSTAVEPKIIFLLVGLPKVLDEKWTEYRRHNRKTSRYEASLPTVKELQDAMQWILVQFQVECILCPDTEFLQSTIHKMTRGLSDRPYINEVTELECIRKIKQGCVGSNDPLEKAKDVWLRQLQQLPGVSENKAQHIAEHFPTCQSLWQAYQWEHHRQQEALVDESDAACSSLLEDKFSADGKLYKKLSDSIYRVLTSNDPDQMIL
mmetsp:Transcript_8883/g.21721  ORF Transcript_8883/g.21721 Transcript_8883/m.21721 type:complete len:525 (+) Transcript_8883:99-1673(+)